MVLENHPELLYKKEQVLNGEVLSVVDGKIYPKKIGSTQITTTLTCEDFTTSKTTTVNVFDDYSGASCEILKDNKNVTELFVGCDYLRLKGKQVTLSAVQELDEDGYNQAMNDYEYNKYIISGSCCKRIVLFMRQTGAGRT